MINGIYEYVTTYKITLYYLPLTNANKDNTLENYINKMFHLPNGHPEKYDKCISRVSRNYEYNLLSFSQPECDVDSNYTVICDPSHKHIFAYVPPRQTATTEQFVQNFVEGDFVEIQDAVEGTLITFFWNEFIGEWDICTRNGVGGDYSFVRPVMSLRCPAEPAIVSPKSYREMVFDCFQVKRDSVNNNFTNISTFSELEKRLTYTCILQHTDNHIVYSRSNCELILLAIHSIARVNVTDDDKHNYYSTVATFSEYGHPDGWRIANRVFGPVGEAPVALGEATVTLGEAAPVLSEAPVALGEAAVRPTETVFSLGGAAFDLIKSAFGLSKTTVALSEAAAPGLGGAVVALGEAAAPGLGGAVVALSEAPLGPTNPTKSFKFFETLVGLKSFVEKSNIVVDVEVTDEELRNNNSPYYPPAWILTNARTRQVTEIQNPYYAKAKALRNMQPNLRYQWLDLMKARQIATYLNAFKMYEPKFDYFQTEYNDFVANVHNTYIQYYVQKNRAVQPKRFFVPAAALHHNVYLPSLREGPKRIISVQVVNDYFESLATGKLYHYITTEL
jgi:hypothetical protein